MSQVKFSMMPLHHGIDSARSGSRDPSDEIVAVHLAALKWNVLQRRFGLVASELAALQKSSVELLELLKSNLPISPVAPSARDAAMPLNRGIATYMHKICTKYLAARFLDRVELVKLERVELVERGRSRRHRGGRS